MLKRYSSILVAIFSVGICSIVLNVSNVNATSVYDNFILSTDQLTYYQRNNASCPVNPLDLTTDIPQRIVNSIDYYDSINNIVQRDAVQAAYNSFAAEVAADGEWTIMVIRTHNVVSSWSDEIFLVWGSGNWEFNTTTNGQSYHAEFNPDSGYGAISLFDQLANGSNGCDKKSILASVVNFPRSGGGMDDGFALEIGLASESSPVGTYRETRFYTSKHTINYPTSYEGNIIPNSTNDLDGDGLSDYVESEDYPNRDEVFCNTNVSPYVCAYPNPFEKDLYLEIDWMDDGTIAYKPSSAQIGLVKSAFAVKGINLHVDIGQFGGGNELSLYEENMAFMPTIGETDFFDIKNGDDINSANFSQDRKDIWRYMIAGDKRDTSSTGAAFAGDDDVFVAMGRVIDLNPSGKDQAIAGTMVHELGHSLCLSDNSAYSGQDASCVFAGIDTSASTDYSSAMNYNFQFSLVDYSTGLNGSNDHNDWSAILLGMNDFIGKSDPTESFSRGVIMQEPED